MSQFKQSKVIHRVNSTVSSNGTLTLVFNSARYQQITGSANHTIVLPDTTTLPKGIAFVISNRGTGTVTVNYNGGSQAATLSANTQKTFIVFDNSTSAGDWDVSNEANGGGGASLNSNDKLSALAGLANSNYQDSENVSKITTYIADEIGADTWTSRSALTAGARYNIGNGSSLNGYGYTLSGSNGASITAANERYDSDNNYWVQKTASSSTRISVSAFAAAGYLYSAFGSVSSNGANQVTTVERFNDSTGTWATMTSGISARARRGVLPMNYVIIGPGADSVGTYQNEVEAYNSANDTWFARSVFPISNGGANSFVLNGFGYISGGLDLGTTASYKYDESANYWSTNASLNLSRGSHPFGDAYNGFGHIFGGGDGSNNPRNTMEQFNDVARNWTSKATMLSSRQYHSNFAVNGEGYIAGGYNGSGVSTVDRYKNASYGYVNLFKRSSLNPSALFVAVSLGSIATSLPVQVRTDGDNWKLLQGNADTATKTGETLNRKFQPANQMYAVGGFDASSALSTRERYNEIANTWVSRASTATTFFEGGEFSLGGVGYYCGGLQAGSASTTTAAYNDITNANVSKSGVLPSSRYGLSGNTAMGGLGYAIAGRDSGGTFQNSTYAYDPTNDAWTTKANKPTALNTSANAVALNRLYSMGGENGGGYQSVFEQYEPVTNAWASKAGLGTLAGYPNAFSINGYVYRNGGSNGSNTYLVSTTKYDEQTNTQVSVANSNNGRYGGASTTYNGYAYAYGGLPSGFTSTPVALNERYNDAANVWTNMTSMNGIRWAHATMGGGAYRNYEIKVAVPALLSGTGGGVWITKNSMPATRGSGVGANLNGILRVAAGISSNPDEYYKKEIDTWVVGQTDQIGTSALTGFVNKGFWYAVGGSGSGQTQNKVFDDSNNTWTTKASTSSQHTGCSTGNSTSLNGFGYVTGGRDLASTGFSGTEQYNPATNAWASKATMSSGRTYINSFPIDGTWYAGGGANLAFTSCVSTFEKYNDASDSWSSATSLNTAQGASACFVLSNIGYIAGGDGPSATATNVVQAYSSAANAWTTKTNANYSAETVEGAALDGTGFLMGGVSSSSVNQFMPSINNALLGLGLRVTES